jgi:hypothetical protein
MGTFGLALATPLLPVTRSLLPFLFALEQNAAELRGGCDVV